MALCALCGSGLSGPEVVCGHHAAVYDDGWAQSNRVMCDFFHRKQIVPRLAPGERVDTVLAQMVGCE